MKIVFLDAKTIGDDIDLSAYDTLGEVVKYSFSQPEEVPERAADADVLIVNKIRIDEAAVGRADHLKLVCVTGTGTNNLDKDYLERRGHRLAECCRLLHTVRGPAYLRHAVFPAGKAALL